MRKPKIRIVLLVLAVVTLLSCTSSNRRVGFSPPIKEVGQAPPYGSDIDVAPIAEGGTQTTEGPPPLVVDTSAPLLLDEPTEEEEASAAATTEAAAENMACFVCHANYRDEFIAQRHAKADVGCVNCHGDSFAHRNDENNTTPPETMYPAEQIDPFCQGCHDAHDIPPKKIIARWIKQKAKKPNATCEGCHKEDDVPPEKVVARWKERDLDKSDPARIVCTDCHGEHRMEVRTVVWDKKTGKILRTNRGD
ncbi:MAG: cytochrome c3 family protein [Planctomycetota bacterium]